MYPRDPQVKWDWLADAQGTYSGWSGGSNKRGASGRGCSSQDTSGDKSHDPPEQTPLEWRALDEVNDNKDCLFPDAP